MSASKTKGSSEGGGGEVATTGGRRSEKRRGLYDQSVPTYYVGPGNNPEL